MTVRELINHLRTCENQDAIVILQKDGEGNGYSPMRDDVDPTIIERYVADSTWSGEIHPCGRIGVPCVVFAPVN